jgi:hypothetical protein
MRVGYRSAPYVGISVSCPTGTSGKPSGLSGTQRSIAWRLILPGGGQMFQAKVPVGLDAKGGSSEKG